MPDLFGFMSREEFQKRLQAGEAINCPCCDRYAKLYRRSLHTSVALQLVTLYRQSKDSSAYLHASILVPRGNTGTGDFTKAKYWDLVDRDNFAPEGQKSSGYWRLTPAGDNFVRGRHKIQKYAVVFDDKVLRFEGPFVTIRECLPEKFNYDEAMQPVHV